MAGDGRRTSWGTILSAPSSFSCSLRRQKSVRPKAAPRRAKQWPYRTVHPARASGRWMSAGKGLAGMHSHCVGFSWRTGGPRDKGQPRAVARETGAFGSSFLVDVSISRGGGQSRISLATVSE